jgi:hypothetical protein
MKLVRAIVARWTAAASLTAPQRRMVEAFVDGELLADLATLRQTLRSADKRRTDDS